jgi:hypothetical protein
MLMVKSAKAIVQIESEDVERVRDLRIGERPRRVKYIRRADLAVERRSEVRGENEVEEPGEGKLGTDRWAVPPIE